MKKLAVLFVLLISSVFLFWSCGTSPDQNKHEIEIFLNGNNFNIIKIITVETEVFSIFGACTTKEGRVGNICFDYIVLAKKDNQNFLLLILADGDFPNIVHEVQIDTFATATTKPQAAIRNPIAR